MFRSLAGNAMEVCRLMYHYTSLCTNTTQRYGSAGDAGHNAMAAAFEEVVCPAAERFQPDLILVRYCSKPIDV